MSRASKFMPKVAGLIARTLACFFLWILSPVLMAKGSDVPSTIYRTSSSEVRVAFFATDDQNRPIQNLGKDDFAVVDSGVVIRDFRSLMRSDETSLHVVVLLDASESVGPHSRAALREVAQLASTDSLTSTDDLAVMSFSGLQPQLLCAANCRGSALEEKLLSLKAEGATPLFDTLVYAASFVHSRHTAGVRDVMILFSDGDDTISRASAHEALETMQASGALLYTIDMSSSEDSRGARTMQQMAEATGGRSLLLQNGSVNLAQTILADLRASYVVTYPLPDQSVGFHSLLILPKHNQNLRFHCRRGYSYEKVP